MQIWNNNHEDGDNEDLDENKSEDKDEDDNTSEEGEDEDEGEDEVQDIGADEGAGGENDDGDDDLPLHRSEDLALSNMTSKWPHHLSCIEDILWWVECRTCSNNRCQSWQNTAMGRSLGHR